MPAEGHGVAVRKEKLIRDKIGDRILRGPEKDKVRVCRDKGEVIGFMLLKGYEEQGELCGAVHSKDRERIIDEIVDKLEVLEALRVRLDISPFEISKRRLAKRAKDGTFKKEYLLTFE